MRRAYGMLQAHAREAAEHGEPYMRARYADFPQRDAAALRTEDVKPLRLAIHAWWERVRRRESR